MKRFNFITGERNSGKTRYLSSLSQNEEYDGVLTLSKTKEKDELFVYFFKSGKKLPLMKRDISGRYIANESTFKRVNEYISAIKSGKVILDECGKIELNKGGFYPSLIHFLNNKEIECYIAVRDTNLSSLISLLKLKDDEYNVVYV